ncbi:penicillin-binding protein 1A [Carnobacterium iners]|uniref:Penicillin-binding protein 1A n=1 Tax=Carnobacterium iners TaxID=1073423 RepID=A0A1X7ND98_9LACT|nr:PBP1A family penicillin-binding protein [Carnobacterium iners]SEK36936.1 penicillin-binding protein 1A [Carnobacterium iners]SMH35673.1 penicillin-binding protein 1A [Carnobacterium iners]
MSEKKENMSRVSKKQSEQKKSSKPTKNKKQVSKITFKKILWIALALVAAIFIGSAGLFVYYVSSAPDLTEKDITGSISSDILDDKGNVIYTLGGQKREIATEDQIPQVLKDAIISIEDQRFYEHNGIDPIRIAGAALANITGGFGSQGGSTITQQLIKLSVFSTNKADQTLKRKAQEAWLALKLERDYSKEQILTFYINKVYMSDNNYGISTASNYYYGKELNEITLPEAAMLAGLPQLPNAYNPKTNPEQAKKRRDLVLDMMVENNKLSAEEAQKTKVVPVEENLVSLTEEQSNDLVFDSYLKEVILEVEEQTKLNPHTAGLTIQTNLDMDAQKRLFDILNSDEYVNFPDQNLQAAVSMVDAKTGQLKAIGGGRNQEVRMGTNRAADMNRSIGSAMKPLSVYGPAIEYLNYSTYQQVVDEPYEYKSGGSLYNYDRKYLGPITMRKAVIDSRNPPAAKTLQEVGYADSTSFLKNLGIDPTKWNNNTGLVESNAIGGEVTPIELSAAYAAFSNGGIYTKPYTVSKVTLQDGEEIDLTPKSKQSMKDSTAYMITDILKDTVNSGSNQNLVPIQGVPQAGKTGTTNYTDEEKVKYNIPNDGVPDSWFNGYSSNYSIAVWVGYDKKFEDGNWLSTSSQQLPRKIYRSLMSYVSQSVENTDWKKPSSVVEVAVEDGSNPVKLPGPNTPIEKIVNELFIKGTQPTAISAAFGEELKAPSGLTAKYNKEKDEITVKWDKYDTANKKETVNYLLTIAGQTVETKNLSYIVQKPTEGEIEITLAVKIKDQVSSKIAVTITVPSKEEEKDSSSKDSSSESSEESSEESSIELSKPESSSESQVESEIQSSVESSSALQSSKKPAANSAN